MSKLTFKTIYNDDGSVFLEAWMQAALSVPDGAEKLIDIADLLDSANNDLVFDRDGGLVHYAYASHSDSGTWHLITMGLGQAVEWLSGICKPSFDALAECETAYLSSTRSPADDLAVLDEFNKVLLASISASAQESAKTTDEAELAMLVDLDVQRRIKMAKAEVSRLGSLRAAHIELARSDLPAWKGIAMVARWLGLSRQAVHDIVKRDADRRAKIIGLATSAKDRELWF